MEEKKETAFSRSSEEIIRLKSFGNIFIAFLLYYIKFSQVSRIRHRSNTPRYSSSIILPIQLLPRFTRSGSLVFFFLNISLSIQDKVVQHCEVCEEEQRRDLLSED